MITHKHLIAGAVITSTLLIPLASHAQTTKKTPTRKTPTAQNHTKTDTLKKSTGATKATPLKPNSHNGISGTVTSNNGTTLTVIGKNKQVITVVFADLFAIQSQMNGLTLSNILVGDKVNITGTLNNGTMTAKIIRDASLEGRDLFSGTITAINQSQLTVQGKNKQTYAIDASASVIVQQQQQKKGSSKGETAITISDILIGDRISAIGSLNGTIVHATKITKPIQALKKIDKNVWQKMFPIK
jgi:hypothetical protein